MRNVVLLAINAKYVHSALAVWLLADSVICHTQTPHTVAVVEVTIHQNDSEIASLVAEHTPDVVGISTYIWNAAKLPGLMELLRARLPNTTFVLGGPEASNNADYWLAQGAHFVVQGEGEHQFPTLLDALANEKPFSPHIETTKSSNWTDPYHESYIRTLKGKLVYLETSRGCPYQCAFCLSGTNSDAGTNSNAGTNGNAGVRFLPLDMAKKQLHKLANSGVRTVKLVDRTFNCNPARAYALFEYVINIDTHCCFHFEVAADLFDAPTIALLRTAPPGRIQFEAGIQSYFPPTLVAISRKTDTDKADDNIRAILEEGNIHMHVDLIAGLPFETLIQFKESFDRAYKLGAHDLQLGFLKLLHGSRLRKEAQALGIRYHETPPYEIIESPWLSTDDINVLKQAENALRHTYNKNRFMTTLNHVLSISKLRPYDLFHTLGSEALNRSTPLEVYAQQLFNCFNKLPGVQETVLKSHMICDWLAMVRGKNMPAFLRISEQNRKLLITATEKNWAVL